ncbi:MAG: hypothetical protein NZ843_01625 [Fimbriimonadales bacterium]|nr:hypothetical protein [Fimbriimonadales bacterium]
MRRIGWIGIGVVSALGILFAFQRMQVEINGRTTNDYLVQGGKVYVSVNALREAGAVVTTGANRINIQFEPLRGRLQGDMVEGRIGEWLSNGVWRVRVVKVEPLEKPGYFKGKGFELTIEIRNLSAQTRSFSEGFDKMILIDDKGTRVSQLAGSFEEMFQRVVRADGFTAKILFGDPYNDPQLGEADKLLITFRSAGGKPVMQGFRIFLRETSSPSE